MFFIDFLSWLAYLVLGVHSIFFAPNKDNTHTINFDISLLDSVGNIDKNLSKIAVQVEVEEFYSNGKRAFLIQKALPNKKNRLPIEDTQVYMQVKTKVFGKDEIDVHFNFYNKDGDNRLLGNTSFFLVLAPAQQEKQDTPIFYLKDYDKNSGLGDFIAFRSLKFGKDKDGKPRTLQIKINSIGKHQIEGTYRDCY